MICSLRQVPEVLVPRNPLCCLLQQCDNERENAVQRAVRLIELIADSLLASSGGETATFGHCFTQILLAAAAVSFGLAFFEGGDGGLRAYVEPMVILIILAINAIVGVWQECNAEAALEALNEMQSEHAAVIRGGKQVSHRLCACHGAMHLSTVACTAKVPATCLYFTL